PLTGTGVAFSISFSTNGLTFNGQLVGTTSAPQQVQVNNNTSGSVTISNITASATFGITTNTCATPIFANGYCVLGVTFTPTAAGPQTGLLTLTDSTDSGPRTLPLSGTGQDFSISAAPGGSTSATISPGQPATYSLGVSPASGFNQSVTLTCTGAPSESTCSVSPQSVTLDGTNAATVRVAVTTTAASLSVPAQRALPRGSRLPLSVWFTALVLLLALAAMLVRRRRVQVVLAAILVVAVLWGSCGGGGSGVGGGGNRGTPAGNYNLIVTGKSQSLSRTLTLTLKVN
ncbi:MAG: hypothetical protein DMG27_14255, partial [Acidobacteria bacterium]